ncbi:MAG TPA: MCE family protein [Pseudonocardiaceae bacterium]
MNAFARLSRDLTRAVALACILALVTAGVVWWVLHRAAGTRITAHFSSAVGLYEGSDVRVLGVRVGTIERVHPEGRTVRVEMVVDPEVDVPADVQAVVVAPSLVSDRYVQLTPVYTGGPRMADGGMIPLERTATPVELDEVYASLDELVTALGPDGANAEGALSDLLRVGAENLQGNGQAMNDTLKRLGEVSRTLAGNREDLFRTVDNLQQFTSMLAANDTQMRQLNDQLAEVNRFLAGEREDLGAALAELATALESVRSFVQDNREKLHSNVDKLAEITQVLVDQRAALAEVLDVAPLALGNLNNSYNAASGTLDTRANINELTEPPIVLICKTLRQVTPNQLPQTLADICGQLAPIVDGLVPLPSLAETISALQQGKLPRLPVPLAPQQGQGGR